MELESFTTGIHRSRAVDIYEYAGHDLDNFGHDFWLTRNGHGAGFYI